MSRPKPKDITMYTTSGDHGTVHVEFSVNVSKLQEMPADRFLEEIGVQFIKGNLPYHIETRKVKSFDMK